MIVQRIDDVPPSELRRISRWLRLRNPLAPVRLVWCTRDDRMELRLERAVVVGALVCTRRAAGIDAVTAPVHPSTGRMRPIDRIAELLLRRRA